MAKPKISIVELGPGTGFKTCRSSATEKKLAVIDRIIAAGVTHMQITSFVSPKAIPQMRDAAEVAGACLSRYPELDLFALVPNFRGAQSAAEAGLKKVTNVISLSASHNKAISTAPMTSPLPSWPGSTRSCPSWSSVWMWPPLSAVPLRASTMRWSRCWPFCSGAGHRH